MPQVVVFPEPCKPAHHDDRRRRLNEIDLRIHRPHQLDQLVIDDLDHQLAGLEAADHFLAHGLLLDLFDKVFDDAKVDIGFEQRGAHLAHGIADVFLADAAPARQAAKDVTELALKVIEHGLADYTLTDHAGKQTKGANA